MAPGWATSRKPAKPSSSGRKLTIKPFKGASAPPPRDAPRDRSGSPPALGHAPGASRARQIPPVFLRPTLTVPSILPPPPPPGPRAEKPKLPSDFEETAWTALAAAVDAVHARAPVGTSLESLYRLVENLCPARLRRRRLRQTPRQTRRARRRDGREPPRANRARPRALPRARGRVLERPLRILENRAIHLLASRQGARREGRRERRDLTLWLFRRGLEGENPTADLGRADERRVAERACAGSNLGGGGTRDASLATRDDAASPQSSVPSDAIAKTVRGVLAVIAKERDGEAIDRARVRRLLRMFSSLGLYAAHFERAFLDASAAHYRAEGDARVVADDASEYLRHCETRLAEEEARGGVPRPEHASRASRDD